jgi:2-oxoglutarate dehydrogenase E2 component (dihydrolipoamide succinyltransferase)
MDVIMPQLGETVAEGTVIKWYKRVGDAVRADEVLFDVETDKVSTEIPAPAAGILTEIVVDEGVTAKVGARLAVISVPGEARTAAPAPEQTPAASESRLSPVVRRLLAEHGVDPGRITGTGPGGRLTREDVLAYVSASKPKANARPLNSVRRRTAEHMARAWATVPHVVQAVEIDFTQIDGVRREIGGAWKSREGFSPTYLPFIAKAVTLALAKFPNLNSVFDSDALLLQERVNIGIAVNLDLDGLVVPVVKDCQSKSLTEIARAINDVSQRARAGTLVPDDLSEGSYTITNNGAFGTLFTAPIINAPQVAILSVDGIRRKPVVVQSADGERIAVAPIGVLAQSFDHRAVDGAYAASFLAELKSRLEADGWRAEIAA